MKKFTMMILAFVLLLCTTSVVFSKGKIADFDAYETYFGKTKNQVKLIAPMMEDLNGSYIVDMSLFHDTYAIYLNVTLDDDVVIFVSAIFETEILDSLDTNQSLENALELGTTILGLDYDNMKFALDDGEKYGVYQSDGTSCLSQKYVINDDDYYLVGCMYIEELDEEKDASNGNSSKSNNSSKIADSVDTNSVKIGDMTMTLLDTSYQGDMLVATFLIENDSKESIYINSFYFDAKDSNYERLTTALFSCPGSSLSGDLAAGDKVKGNICFENAKAKPIIITYKPDLWRNDIFSFKVK